MYRRSLSDFLLEEGSKYPIITIVGPRQSGKTTLARTLFPDFTYHSFEDPDLRQTVVQDPRGFFARGASEKADQSLILDEIQKAPEVLSYLQTLVDQPNNKRRFILTGSHNFLLMEKVSQTLAGRTLLTTLLPLSYEELPSPKTDLDLLMFLFL